MHLFHHINFKIAAGVYLAEITREDLTAAQLCIMGDVKLHLSPFNNLLLSSMFGQSYWISRLYKAGASNQHIIIMSFRRLKWAWGCRIGRINISIINTEIRNLMRSDGSRFFWLFVRSFRNRDLWLRLSRFGASVGLFTFAFLLGFACPLRGLWQVSVNIRIWRITG